jgi:predicted lipoprotein with Yx(FWY)xxD motif
MQTLGTRHRLALFMGALAVLAALAAVGARGSTAARDSSTAKAHVVKTVENRMLDQAVLVNVRGRTLYSLSAETRGRFICTTTSCLSLWTPLVVAHGTTPTGAKLLATIRRPDGRTQVTYRGRPLYTFVQDRGPGDVKGNGFKDVGVWHPASPTAAKAATPPSGGYGGLYG